MSFTRTRSGISNLRLFYGADLIVFTEGGAKSFSSEEVEKGEHSTCSVDIKFWNYIFLANNFDRKVKFRAIGSKTVSKSICEKIISNEVNNVAVARDRDLDEHLGLIFDSPFILYTKGYSWENDVFTKELTYEQIESMLFMAEIPEEVWVELDDIYDDFRRIGKSLAKLEIIFRRSGVQFIWSVNGDRFFDGKKVRLLIKSKFP